MSFGPFPYLLLAFGYFQAGYWLARLSWKVWHGECDSAVLRRLLFPVTATLSRTGPQPGSSAAIDEFEDPRRYELWMALVWPLKAVWNVGALGVIAFAAAAAALGLVAAATLKLLVYGPERIVRWTIAASKRGGARSLGGIAGILPVAIPPARKDADAVSPTEGGGHGIR